MKELPFQTYKRVTGCKWPGGKSDLVRLLLHAFHIHHEPGSAEANLELQAQLLAFEHADREHWAIT